MCNNFMSSSVDMYTLNDMSPPHPSLLSVCVPSVCVCVKVCERSFPFLSQNGRRRTERRMGRDGGKGTISWKHTHTHTHLAHTHSSVVDTQTNNN